MIIRKIIRSGSSVNRILRGGVIQWQRAQDTPKLSTPVIYLDFGNEQPEGLTPAILGKAILGRTILGKTVVQVLPKLDAPTIYLLTQGEEVPDDPVIVKLAAPTIRLEVVNQEEPDTPDVPVTPKLGAPVIYLSSDEGIQGATPAILGKAILGKTILGRIGSSLPKLSAPVIRLTETAQGQKLDAPVIRLETVSDQMSKLSTPTIRLEVVDDEQPDIPVVQKLAAPEIYLEVVDDTKPEDPIVVKLAAPTIRLEIIQDEEPDVPEVTKLIAPVIRLEVIDDEEPDTPVEPDIPVTPKLSAPVVYLEIIEYEQPDEPDVPDEPEVPTTPKLSAPEIYLHIEAVEPEAPVEPEPPTIVKLETPEIYLHTETEEPDEPTEPDIPIIKLDAPSIYLEVIEDEIPSEPDVPDEPTIQKLSAPVIELHMIAEEPEVPETPDEPERPDAPVLRVEGRDLVWDAVPGVTRYQWWFRSKAFGEEYSPWGNLPIQSYVTRLSLDAFNSHQYPGGMLETYLIAEVDGVESAPSNTVLYVMLPPKLNAPVIELETVEDAVPTLAAPVVSLNGSILSWNAVDGATVYAVMYDNNVLAAAVTETSVDLADVFKTYDAGEFNVSVVAVATGESGAYSASSNAVVYRHTPKLAAPVITLETVNDNDPEEPVLPKLYAPYIILKIGAPTVYLDGDTLRWTAVDEATEYWVRLSLGSGQYATETVEGLSKDLSIHALNNPPGTTFKYYVIAVDKVSGATSDYSNTVTYTVQ